MSWNIVHTCTGNPCKKCDVNNGARKALSELLSAEGFETMSREVLEEYDPERLRRYARIVTKNAPQKFRPRIARRLQSLGMVV